MKTILIAGGAGFIGSNLTIRYLENGHKVVVLDNFSTGNLDNLAEVERHPNLTVIEHDVCEAVPALDIAVDEIFHLASPASPPKYLADPLGTMWVNSIGTRNLLELAQAKRARFLFASTSEVYGDPLSSPQVETYWGNVNPIGPRSVYDEAKRFGEALLAQWQRGSNCDSVIVRIFNTYGPKMDPLDGRVVSTFIRQALLGEPLSIYGTGRQTRSFCFIDDLIDGLIMTMNSDIRGPVNLGNPNELTLLELADRVSEVVGKELAIDFFDLPVDDPQQRCPDISYAKATLGWNPLVAIDEGIRRTSEWIATSMEAKPGMGVRP